jgi:tetratricopeptide (TPR) repeat protein
MSRLTFTALLLSVAGVRAFAQSPADTQLHYKVDYQCNGERLQVAYCRKDSDRPGFPATTPEENYCLVYYPDRPKSGGLTVQAAELRGDVVKRLQACGALAMEKSTSGQSNSSAESYIIEANKYLDEKQYANAITAYKQAIALQPSSGAYVDLGFAYYQLTQYQTALPYFEKAVRLKPDDDSSHYWVGVTHYQLKQYADALTALQEAIRLNPKDSNSYHWLGEVYLNGFKQYDKAVTAYLEARRLDPSDARNHNELGLAYDSHQQYDDALAEFKEAVRLKPDEPLYQSNLGIAFLRLKKTDEAKEVSAALAKLDKKMAEDLDQQISELMDDMKHPNNQQGTAAAQPSTTGNAETYFAEGERYYQAKDYAKAIPPLREAVRRNPDYTSAWFRLGLSYFLLKQYQDALAAFQQCTRLAPNSADVEYMVGLTYFGLGQKDAALEAYRKLQPLNKEEAQKLYDVINGKQETSAPAGPAKPATPAAQPNRPPDASTPMARQYILMGTLQEQQGKTDEAKSSYLRAIAIHPDPDTLAMAHLYLGTLYRDQKHYAEAVSSYKESLLARPDAHTSYMLGVCYLEMGKKEEAMEIYRAIQSSDKEDADQLLRQIQNTN